MQPHAMQTQSCSEQHQLAQIDSNSGLEVGLPREQSRFLSTSRGPGGRRHSVRGHAGTLVCTFPRLSWGFFSRGLRRLSGGKCLKSLARVLRPSPSLPVGVMRGEDGTTPGTCCASWQELRDVVAMIPHRSGNGPLPRASHQSIDSVTPRLSSL